MKIDAAARPSIHCVSTLDVMIQWKAYKRSDKKAVKATEKSTGVSSEALTRRKQTSAMRFCCAGSALFVLIGLLSTAAGFQANADTAIDLQPGACTAFEITDLPHKYSYDVDLIGLTGICINSNIRYRLPTPLCAALATKTK